MGGQKKRGTTSELKTLNSKILEAPFLTRVVFFWHIMKKCNYMQCRKIQTEM